MRLIYLTGESLSAIDLTNLEAGIRVDHKQITYLCLWVFLSSKSAYFYYCLAAIATENHSGI